MVGTLVVDKNLTVVESHATSVPEGAVLYYTDLDFIKLKSTRFLKRGFYYLLY